MAHNGDKPTTTKKTVRITNCERKCFKYTGVLHGEKLEQKLTELKQKQKRIEYISNHIVLAPALETHTFDSYLLCSSSPSFPTNVTDWLVAAIAGAYTKTPASLLQLLQFASNCWRERSHCYFAAQRQKASAPKHISYVGKYTQHQRENHSRLYIVSGKLCSIKKR